MKAEYIVENNISFAKSSVGVVTLPCGIITGDGSLVTDAEVREICGDEEDLLANENVPMLDRLNGVISACTTRIGTTTDPKHISSLVLDALIGDRFALLFAIRRATLGDEVPFEWRCPSVGCVHHKSPTVMLLHLSEFEQIPMKDATKRAYETTLPSSGLVVKWHPSRGLDELKASKVNTPAAKLSALFLTRVDFLGDAPPTLNSLRALDLVDRQALRDAFQDAEGGLDLEVEIECPGCGREATFDFDPGIAGFFYPSAMLKRWKRKYGS